MGAYTADGLMSAELEQWLLANVAQPVVDKMASEGSPFHGILFCGMMMTPPPSNQPDGSIKPMVLEFNTRFGDPETEAILVRLESDIVDLFDAAIDGTAERLAIKMKPGASVCVIAASGGYPGKVVNGQPISGLDLPAAESSPSPQSPAPVHRPQLHRSKTPSPRPTPRSKKSPSTECSSAATLHGGPCAKACKSVSTDVSPASTRTLKHPIFRVICNAYDPSGH
jgi:hypothetical protein